MKKTLFALFVLFSVNLFSQTQQRASFQPIPTNTLKLGGYFGVTFGQSAGLFKWDSAYINNTLGANIDMGGAVFNVLAYGVKGDSTTNESTKIQNAINAGAGGTVYFPGKKNYKINATVTIPSNTTLVFDQQAYVFAGTNLNAPMFRNSDTLNGNTNVNIFGGILDGNKANQSTSTLRTPCIWFKHVNGGIIQMLEAKNAKARAIGSVDGANISLDSCRFIDVIKVKSNNSANTGMMVWGGSNVSVYGGTYSNNAVTGIDFVLCPRSKALGVTADTNGSSGISTHSLHTIISECSVDSATQGINIGEDGVNYQGSYAIVSNNNSQHCNYGIKVQGDYTVGVQISPTNVGLNNYISNVNIAHITNTTFAKFQDSLVILKGLSVGDIDHIGYVFINAHNGDNIALDAAGWVTTRGAGAGIRGGIGSINTTDLDIMAFYNNTGGVNIGTIVGGAYSPWLQIVNAGTSTFNKKVYIDGNKLYDALKLSGGLIVTGISAGERGYVGSEDGVALTLTAATNNTGRVSLRTITGGVTIPRVDIENAGQTTFFEPTRFCDSTTFNRLITVNNVGYVGKGQMQFNGTNAMTDGPTVTRGVVGEYLGFNLLSGAATFYSKGTSTNYGELALGSYNGTTLAYNLYIVASGNVGIGSGGTASANGKFSVKNNAVNAYVEQFYNSRAQLLGSRDSSGRQVTNGVTINETEAKTLIINSTHANGAFAEWQRSGTPEFEIGYSNGLGGSINNYDIYAQTGLGVRIFTNGGTQMLALSSAGSVTLPTGLTGTLRASSGVVSATASDTVGLGVALYGKASIASLGSMAYETATNYSPVTGSGSIATVGTITSGEWDAGAITAGGSITCASVYSDVANTRAVYVEATGLLGTLTSSRRYKANIIPLEINTDNLYKLQPSSFTRISNGKREFGLIAEEVVKYVPEIVDKDSLGRPDYVGYERLPTLLLDMLQKQHKQILNLTKRIVWLEAALKKKTAK